MRKIRIAIVGYGNIGKYAINAVESATDMELVGIVSHHLPETEEKCKTIKIVNSIDKLSAIDVAILCSASRNIENIASEILQKGINTVDSFDIHSDIYDLKIKLNKIAKKAETKSIISAGWDPGSDSIIRALFQVMTPFGLTYTNFGPGMSMGHSVVAKSKNGVADALSMTMPAGDGIHRRIVYLQMKEGENFENACKEIKNDSYFINDETKFIQVESIQDIIDVGHGVNIHRKGASGQTHNQLLDFNMKINNPALTSQIMVSCARATMKIEAGCYTMIEVPLIKMLNGSEENLIKSLV